MTDTTTAKPKRPRSTRYMGRQSREVLIPDELDEWVSKQMGAKWSRNQVIEQCISLAMGKVATATEQEEAVAASLAQMQASIDGLTQQMVKVLAILNVDTRARYPAPNDKPPQTFQEFRSKVQDAAQRMMGDANDSAQ